MLDAVAQTSGLLALDRRDGFFAFDSKQCAQLGESLHQRYVSNRPFEHIVVDDFIAREILLQVVEEFPKRETGRFADSYSLFKTGYTLERIHSAYIHDLLNALNSAAFLVFLEKLTGIRGLISDPHFAGGGLHETARGGHLSIHADFNIHPRLKLVRRLNLILFLNPYWEPDWGGALELWDRGMKRCEQQVVPLLGRAVIFNTDTTSYHGHPEPLACPDNVYRRSIALYYYTAPHHARMVRHSTLFQPRPGSADRQLSLREQAMNWGYRLADRARRARERHPAD